LLTEAAAHFIAKNEMPASLKTQSLYGPTRPYIPAAGRNKPTVFSWQPFAGAVRQTSAYCRDRKRIPDEIWIGVDNISPQDYLVTLAAVVEELMTTGKSPGQVPVREGKLATEKYIAEDSPELWGWVIFPEGFRAPKIMELARLQAWTLKPAVLQK
jgi:hypothetical protein